METPKARQKTHEDYLRWLRQQPKPVAKHKTVKEKRKEERQKTKAKKKRTRTQLRSLFAPAIVSTLYDSNSSTLRGIYTPMYS